MNLFRTTAFKLAVRFALIFILIAFFALTSMYYFTMTEIAAQTDRELIHEVGELEAQFYQEGRQSLIDLIQRRDVYGKHLHHFYALQNPDGSLAAGNEKLFQKVAINKEPLSGITFSSSDTTIYGAHADDILRIARTALEDGSAIVVGQEQQSLVELRANSLSAMMVVIALSVVLSLASGYFMGRHVLRHVNRIDEGLANAINNNFEDLLPIPKEHNEFFALTEKLNLMLVRIRDLISSIRQVSDNVAHELRGPLTRMRSRLEVTLLQSRSSEEYQVAMGQAIEDCNDLLTTFNALLSIARAESGVKKDDWSTLDLTGLLDELAELYIVVAEDAGHELVWEKPKQRFAIKGNRQLVAQAFSNILENAIKYTPKPGRIILNIMEENGCVLASFCDNGMGIPPEDRTRVLERFQRLNKDSRILGSGLGLHLVQAVAKLHGADLLLEDNQPGLCVKLLFKSED